MKIQPIFIFSLPRAGSTLLQRLLNQHVEIVTAPEPWIALPLFFSLKTDGVKSIYGHGVLSNATRGFIDTFEDKRKSYNTCVSEFLINMYELGSESNSRYFLDKTPRYHLIVDDLMEAFPDAKFIFLWRNPLAIAASMIKTWGSGNWNLYMFLVDLYRGMDSLVTAYNNNQGRSIALKYEDLVSSPDDEISRIMPYLDLDYDENIVKNFKYAKKIEVPGRGDPTGQYIYNGVSKGSMDGWKSVMSNPFRKAWSKGYLQWIGENRMDVMGYNIDELISEIETQKTSYRYLTSDILRNIYGKIYCKYSIEIVKNNIPWKDDIYFCKN